MTIRAYQNKDWKEIMEMMEDTMNYHLKIADPAIFNKSSYKILANYVRSITAKARTGSGRVFVSVESGRLTGFVAGEVNKYSPEKTRLAKKVGTIQELYVVPDERSRGVAARLMREMENFLKENGCELILLSDVHRKNLPATKLYEKLGYHVRASEYVKELKK